MNSHNQVKIAVIGKKGAGKTSVVNAFVGSDFQKITEPTVGITTTTLPINGINVKISDTSGNPRYADQAKQAIQDADIILYVFNANTTSDLLEAELKAYDDGLVNNGRIQKRLCYAINKCDELSAERKSSLLSEEMKRYPMRQISCKDNTGIPEFVNLVKFHISEVAKIKQTQQLPDDKTIEPSTVTHSASASFSSRAQTPSSAVVPTIDAKAPASSSIKITPVESIRTVPVSPRGVSKFTADNAAPAEKKAPSTPRDIIKTLLQNKVNELEKQKETWFHWFFYNTEKTNAKIRNIGAAIAEVADNNNEIKATCLKLLSSADYEALRAHRSVGFFSYHYRVSDTYRTLRSIYMSHFHTERQLDVSAPVTNPALTNQRKSVVSP